MNIKIVNKNGVTLRTEGKYCSEDINVTIDPSLLGSQFTTEEKTFTPTPHLLVGFIGRGSLCQN